MWRESCTGGENQRHTYIVRIPRYELPFQRVWKVGYVELAIPGIVGGVSIVMHEGEHEEHRLWKAGRQLRGTVSLGGDEESTYA